MASEILQEKGYTTASDIYSFSMIMWELIISRMPFWDQNNDMELLYRNPNNRNDVDLTSKL